MRAVVIHRFGGPEVLELAELDIPEPTLGQVLIRVEAATVNPVDVATRAGWLADQRLMRANGQVGLGWDLAGTIDAVGPGTDRFQVGDAVIGMRDLLSTPIGAQAVRRTRRRRGRAGATQRLAGRGRDDPAQRVDRREALDLLALRDGEWLLVTGAAGALGGFALELAALRGLRTIAVASPGDEALVCGLGAHESSPVPTMSAPPSAASFPVASTAPLTPPSSESQRLTRFATVARS
jgi:NADPH:quinone reductase